MAVVFKLPKARKSPSWVDKFVEWTAPIVAPEKWRKWCALAAISGVVERRIWTATGRGPVYPSIFVLLVGPPGSGKSVIVRPVRQLWARAETVNVAPDSMTKAAMIDHLKQGLRSMRDGDAAEVYHSLAAGIPEFDVFMPTYDQQFLSHCSLFWDCEPIFTERLRGRGEPLIIDNPFLTLLAGVQPAVMNRTFPEGAWGQGFMARCIFSYAEAVPKDTLFNRPELNHVLEQELANDLKAMYERTGLLGFTKEAVEVLEAWYKADCPPQPVHPRLVYYNSRRALQSVKLSLLVALANAHPLITADDFLEARDLLILAEEDLPEMLQAIMTADRSHSEIYHTLHSSVLKYQLAHKKPCPEHILHRMVMLQVSNPQMVEAFILNALKSGMLKREYISGEFYYTAGVYQEDI